MDLKLNDKRALVMGASRGLGFAIGRGLALEGAAVTLNSRSPEKLAQAAQQLQTETGQTVHTLAADASDPTAPAEVIASAVEAMGGLDLLVTNAGGPPAGAFESFDEDTWAKAVDLSFMSHVRLIRAALAPLRQSEAPSVLTITSITVKQPIPNLVLSNSVRAATVGLTKTLASELGAEGIRFNSLMPGSIETERIYELMDDRAERSGRTREEELAAYARETPLGRMGQPEEFANAAVFLLSPAASYITGVSLLVDGGAYKGFS